MAHTHFPLLALLRHSLFSLAACASLASALSFSSIEHVFSFGDSLTSIGYDPTRGASSLTPLTTSTGGDNWIQYLHDEAAPSDSFYNLASWGATISNDVINGKGAADFRSQVATFASDFGAGAGEVRWTGENALFTVWFGSDDLYNSLMSGADFIKLQPFLLTDLDSSIAYLYAAGARNFLLMDIPSLGSSPLALAYGSAIVQSAVIYWNERLAVYAQYFDQIFPGATAVFYKTSEFSRTILDAPATYGIQNTVSACDAYMFINNDPTASVPACGAPLKDYFWKDNWHPSLRIHRLLAQDIASVLTNNITLIKPGAAPLSSPPLPEPARTVSVIFPLAASSIPIAVIPIVVGSSSPVGVPAAGMVPVVAGTAVPTYLIVEGASSTSMGGQASASAAPMAELVTGGAGRVVGGWGVGAAMGILWLVL